MPTLDLTMADFDMLDDALFQRAGDAATAREESRWLSLRAKLGVEAVKLERQECACGHARKSHRGDGKRRCVICSCRTFEDAARREDRGDHG